MKILLTGATGFVGNYLLTQLKDFEVSLILRNNNVAGYKTRIADLNESIDLSNDLNGIEVVIHCAARAHIMNETSLNPLDEYRKINVDATMNLARQAASAGIKRFIYLSSIKVNGEQTFHSQTFKFDDIPKPEDPYGVSKLEAELGLKEIALETGMELVIIRPPLVYGPGVKGNFDSLLKLTMKRLPLPLGRISNKRSMVSVQNLVDLIVTCIDHPNAVNQTFLVCDDEDLSTSDLLRRLGSAAWLPARLINIPVSVLRFIARLVGKEAAIDRLTGSLQVDISHTKQALDWKPPYTVDEGLASCFVKSDP